MIKCGNCGKHHASVDDVRACHGSPAHESVPAPRPTALDRSPEPTALDRDWDQLAGPPQLGRNIVLAPGTTPPSPWATAPTVVLDNDPEHVVAAIAKLQELRAERTAAVIYVGKALPVAQPVLDTDYWNLAPDTDLPGEQLRYLVLSHAVDARNLQRPTIQAVDLALAAGAQLATEHDGDVVVDGTPAWCDGGPLDWFDNEPHLAILPAANIGGGSQRLLRRAQPSAELAADQYAAVTHSGAGARVIAPAGSGKTRVLTERARHLIRDRGIDPRSLCLLAFNVRAREEMQQRTTDLEGLEIRTLNSLALAILRGSGPFRSPTGRRSPNVIDEREIRRVLDDLVKTPHQAMADPIAVWIEALTATRLGLRSPEAVERDFDGDVKGFAQVAPEFRRRLQQAGVVDFDEQILGAIEVLCTDPHAREVARRACQIMLVDEFQDLTPAHILLIRLLAGPAANVFGVGDDDQTIYGYSGASPEWLIDFHDLFNAAGTHDLTRNYRCAPAVVEGVTNLLTHNRRRVPKKIAAAPDRHEDDGELLTVTAPDTTTATFDHTMALLDQGVQPRDIAILTRVNATLLGPMIALGEAGVPNSAPIGVAFLERTGIAGALAWLRLATAPARRLPGPAIEVAARRPPRGLSRRVTEWMGENSSTRELVQLAGRLNKERDQKKVSDFVADLSAVRAVAEQGTTEAVLVAIRDKVGLGSALDNRLDASRRSVDRSAHGDDLAALLAVARHQPDAEAFPAWLTERLSNVTPDWSGVRLSTIHRVKGQEWPHVVVHEASAGLMPHRLSSDIEEERRVFHVAVTRSCRTTLVVSNDPASPFVQELRIGRDPNQPWPAPTTAPHVTSSKPTSTGSTARSPAKRGKRQIPEASTVAEASLRERLRAWRNETAKTAGVPAYVVFNDTTLYELAEQRPLNNDELLDISGFGPVKVERYGEAVTALISELLDES